MSGRHSSPPSGLGVLYKRRTGPIAMVLFGIYFVIAAIIAYAMSGS